MFALIQTLKNVLKIFIHRSNVLYYSTEFYYRYLLSSLYIMVIKQFRNFTTNKVFNQYKALVYKSSGIKATRGGSRPKSKKKIFLIRFQYWIKVYKMLLQPVTFLFSTGTLKLSVYTLNSVES